MNNKVYFYNANTFEYAGEGLARLDPEASRFVGKEVFTKPANSTYVVPPVLKEFEIAVFNIETEEWVVKKSYKGSFKLNAITGAITEITNNELIKSFEFIIDKEILDDVLSNPIKYDVVDGKVVDISKMQKYQSKYNIRKYKRAIQEAKEAYLTFQETPVKFHGMEFLPRYLDDYCKLALRSFPMEIWDYTGTKCKLMTKNEFEELKGYLETLDSNAYSEKKNAIKKYKIEIAKLEKENG